MIFLFAAVGTLRRVGSAAVDWLVLRRAKQEARSYSEAQREFIREHFTAGLECVKSANVMRVQGRAAASLVLYREGARLLLAAASSARDESLRADEMAPAEACNRLSARVAQEGLAKPPGPLALIEAIAGASVRQLLEMPHDAALAWLADVDRMVRWLTSLVEPRSIREIRRASLLRTFVLASTAVALSIVLVLAARRERNVALDKQVASSPLAYSTRAEGAVDGNKDGSFGFHTTGDDEGWLQIDLGREHELSRIVVFGRQDCCFDQSVPLSLSLGVDGAEFVEESRREAPFSESSPWIVPVQHRKARYVKLRRIGSGYLVLSEVEVYAKKKR